MKKYWSWFKAQVRSIVQRRYYSPILGRWITPDPLGNKDGPNLYAYVHNSPLLAFDLYGLEANGNSGFWKGVFDYFYNGFRELGPHVCSRIKMGWEMQHRLIKDPVGHGKWIYGKGNRFISQIPNEMNWQSVKNGSFNALESFFPCTADAIAQVGHYQNNYERGYYIGKAASEIAVFVFATTFAELAVERFAMSKSLKVSSTLTQELAESKAIANIAKEGARKANFIVGANGIAIPTSRAVLEAGFQKAGFEVFATESKGIGYILPNFKVRVMEPAGRAPLRASFTNFNHGYINPFSGKPIHPPSGLNRTDRLDFIRQYSHLELDP